MHSRLPDLIGCIKYSADLACLIKRVAIVDHNCLVHLALQYLSVSCHYKSIVSSSVNVRCICTMFGNGSRRDASGSGIIEEICLP